MNSTDDSELSRTPSPSSYSYWSDDDPAKGTIDDEPVVTTTPGKKKQGGVIREVI